MGQKQGVKIKKKKELIAHLRQKGEVKKILSLKKLPKIRKEKKKKSTKDKKPSAISKICAKFKGKKNANQKVVPAVDDAPSDEVTDKATKVVELDEAEENDVGATSSVVSVTEEQKVTPPSTGSAELAQQENAPTDTSAAVAVAPPAQAQV